MLKKYKPILKWANTNGETIWSNKPLHAVCLLSKYNKVNHYQFTCVDDKIYKLGELRQYWIYSLFTDPSPPVRQTSYVGPGASPLPPIGGSGGGGGAMWTCAHCTFLNNPDKSTCDMCSLPK